MRNYIPLRGLARTFAFVGCLLGTAAAVTHAQGTKPATLEALGKEPLLGKWQPMCPRLQLPAHRSSIKLATPDGAVVGSGLTSQVPSIALCKNGNVAWRTKLNTLPDSLSTRSSTVYYAGMSPGRGTAMGAGAFVINGRETWSARIDGSGNEAHAAIAPTYDGAFVLGASSASLPGQPKGAKGYRYLAGIDQRGKVRWVKQSKEFGLRPVEKGGGDDRQPAVLAADFAGNAVVLVSLPEEERARAKGGKVSLATLAKFNPKGKVLWRKQVALDLGSARPKSFRATLRAMAIERDATSIYLLGDAVRDSRSELVVMRLDSGGNQQWAKLLSLGFSDSEEGEYGEQIETSGDTFDARGIAIGPELLLVTASYELMYFEAPSEEEAEFGATGVRDESHVAVIAGLDPQDGTLSWARQYLGMGSQTGSASEFEPSGIQILNDGSIAVSGQDDIYVAQKNEHHQDVASVFLLQDAKVSNPEWGGSAAMVGFLADLKRAVRKADKQWIANHIAYPCCPNEKGATVKTKAEFIKNYDSIVNENVRDAVLNEPTSPMITEEDGYMVGHGQVWFSSGLDPQTGLASVAIATFNSDAPPTKGGGVTPPPSDETKPESPAQPPPTSSTPSPTASKEEEQPKPEERPRDKIKGFFKSLDDKNNSKKEGSQ